MPPGTSGGSSDVSNQTRTGDEHMGTASRDVKIAVSVVPA
jgi:hypothetical protein